MKKILWGACLAIAVLISACGGGGGSTGASDSSSSGSSGTGTGTGTGTSGGGASASNGFVTVGDFVTYMQPLDNSRVNYMTDTITGVGADGSYTVLRTSANEITYGTINIKYSADLQELSYTSSTLTCTNTPQIDNPGRSLKVGQSWNISYVRSCVDKATGVARSANFVNSGTVVSLESMNKDFPNAYRLKGKTTIQGLMTFDYEVMRDVSSSIAYLNIDYSNYDPVNGFNPIVNRLNGYSTASPSRSSYDYTRFGGFWTLTWTGTTSGQCPRMIINVSYGGLMGTCTITDSSGRVTQADIQGGVRSDGSFNAVKIGSNISLSGSLTSVLQGAGIWSGQGQSGTWQATRH